MLFYNDAPTPYGLIMQDSASPIAIGMQYLHDLVMYYLVIVLIVVIWMECLILARYRHNNLHDSTSTHGATIEILWTLLPAAILCMIALPSFSLLYLADSVIDTVVTLKVIGRQWYWNYEYPLQDKVGNTIGNIAYDSYLQSDSNMIGQLRLATTDMPVVLPIDGHTRILTNASDVMHSWAIPALGMKADSIPGRINQLSLLIPRASIFYGQCSELCGTGHAYMPITLIAIDVDNYLNWQNSLAQ